METFTKFRETVRCEEFRLVASINAGRRSETPSINKFYEGSTFDAV
jgi:hypothetical protein